MINTVGNKIDVLIIYETDRCVISVCDTLICWRSMPEQIDLPISAYLNSFFASDPKY